MTDIPSPGGWLQTYGVRVSRGLAVGAVGAAAVVTIFGTLNGGKTTQYCEASLVSTTQDTVAYSCQNPLNESGAVEAVAGNIIQLVSAPSPRTRVDICSAASATTACTGTAAGANIASGVTLFGPKNKLMALSATGGMTLATPVIISPGNATGNRFINVTFVNGSGQTTNGLPAANIRIQIRPCNLAGVGC